MTFLSDHDLPSLSSLFRDWNFNPTHAPTLLSTFYQQHGHLDLPSLRIGHQLSQRVERELPLLSSSISLRTQSSDGTVKLLLKLDRGGSIESVLMPAYDPTRAAGCISSQVGCAMGCDFCASTKSGLERNLEPGEIVEQFLHLRRECAAAHRRLSTIVFMGMGEPMHNLDNVISAVHRISSPKLGALGPRQITISTVGIIPGIDELAAADLGVYLALSLHAPDDETRTRIVPINRRYPVRDIMDAAIRFQHRTGRVVNIEYCMLSGINDSLDHAEKLAHLLAGHRMHVNLIPYNSIGLSISGQTYHAPSWPHMEQFINILLRRKIAVHFRRPRGHDVNAACGQLRQTAASVG